MGFPTDPLNVHVELNVGGTWTDVTADVRLRDPITNICGSADQGSGVDPGKCKLQFRNGHSKVTPAVVGRYSPRNPRSDLYGLIGRNTPLRVSVHTGATYLALPGGDGDRVTTPDVAALDITGDIDVRLDATLEDWGSIGTTSLVGKYNTTGNQRSWRLLVLDGALHFTWSTTGADFIERTATQRIPQPSKRLAVRATLDVNNGAGGHTVTFYTAPTNAGPWTQLGEPVVGAGTTSIFASTTALEIGDITNLVFAEAEGKIHAFELRNGIGGSAVANPDFTAPAIGATSFTDAAGRTWTLNGGTELTNRRIRFLGEVSSWPPRWDVAGNHVWVPVEAAGILRRLGQGAKALDSTLRRRIPSGNPRAYWPLEEDRDATQGYSPIAGVTPLKVSGFDFAADDTLSGSSALPALQNPASMTGIVPTYTGTGEWLVEFVYNLDAMPGSLTTMMEIATTDTVSGNQGLLRISVATNNVKVDHVSAASTVSIFNLTSPDFTGNWHRLQLYAKTNGGSIDYTINWISIGENNHSTTTTVTGTVGKVTAVASLFGAGLEGMRLGHIGVFDSTATTIYNFADHGFTSESAGARVLRLGVEEGVPVSLHGFAGDTETMGPQRPATLLELLEECADADEGVLLERRDTAALRYRTRVTRYNQAVALALDYTAVGEVAPPLEPIDDDAYVRNDVTVQRTSGSSARAVDETGPLSTQAPPNGVGRYDESVTLNLETDDQPAQHAGWRLHLGTWDEARYPTVHVKLHRAPHLIDAVVGLDVGDRITIANLPAWLPPGGADLIVQGYTEVLRPRTWDMEFTCAPAGPWTVGVTDDAVLGRADTDGSELASGVTSTATSLSVATTSGPLWTTDGADAPFDIRLGGEVMTVTAISGSTSPQAFTVTRSANGVVKSHSAGVDVRLAYPAIAAL